MEYNHLQIKTSSSLLSSLIAIKKVVIEAKKLGYTSLAITDKNNLSASIEFYYECLNNNLKPIIGLDLDYQDSYLLLYAKNNNGYKNLCKLVTIKSEREITLEDLELFKDDLICITPYSSYSLSLELKSIYQDFYIGYSSLEEANEIKEPKVFIKEVLYLKKSDYQYLDYLYMIRDLKTIDAYNFVNKKGHHLLTKEEIIIKDQEDLINNQNIIKMCNVNFKKQRVSLPVFDKEIDSFKYLTSLCLKGLEKRLNKQIKKEYLQRLNYELSVINKMGFNDYFLIIWDIVKYAKNNNILVGPGRGSAAGSLVAYTLGITEIDPLEYNLMFERFLNPERITMPDIDIDFDAAKRDEIIDYVHQKYPHKQTAQIITFGTFGSKQIIRDIGRCLNINIKLIDRISNLIDGSKSLKENYIYNARLKNLITNDKEFKQLFKIASHLEGLPRHASIHAAGVIMSNQEIDNIIPLELHIDDKYLTGLSMKYLEDFGLLKMDFLGLKNLTLINDINNNIDEKIDLNEIDLTDEKTIDIFNQVNTVGIFQFESKGMKNFLQKLKVSSFDDVVAAIALFRPGPMANIDTYIRRKQKQEKINYLHQDLKPILDKTYGIIIYQEQIMEILKVIGGYSYAEADVLRRAITKKEEHIFIDEKEKFLQKSTDKGYSKQLATEIYDLILKFANYGFNKAHSVAYAKIGFQLAYLKAHYPKQFFLNLLSSVIGSETKTKEYITECQKNHIKVLTPDINESDLSYKVVTNGLLYSLTNIKGVGYIVANKIIKEREEKPFTSALDFITRCYGQSVNKKVITNLIYAGCFNQFNVNKKTLINNLDAFINYSEIVNDVSSFYAPLPEVEEYEEYEKIELLSKEKEVFGFYLSMHPTDEFKEQHHLDLEHIQNYFDKLVNVIIFVERKNEIQTKNNEAMCFLEGSDNTRTVDFVLFPKTYEKYKNISRNDILKIKGKVEKRFNKYQIIVDIIDKVN